MDSSSSSAGTWMWMWMWRKRRRRGTRFDGFLEEEERKCFEISGPETGSTQYEPNPLVGGEFHGPYHPVVVVVIPPDDVDRHDVTVNGRIHSSR
jgi:hypothetical protein